MKTGKLLTLEMLEQVEACSDQIDAFKQRFGNEVKVTKKLCESVAQVFDWRFVFREILGESSLDGYNKLWSSYYRTAKPIAEAHLRQQTALWTECKQQQEQYINSNTLSEEECERECKLLVEEFKWQRSILLEEAERKVAPLRRKIRRKCAILFWKLYNNEDITIAQENSVAS